MPKQESIYNEVVRTGLVDEFTIRLLQLKKAGRFRHGLAAMALAMQQELTRHDHKGLVAHTNDLELIMRGVYSALVNDGSKDPHAVEKLSGGFCGLMCCYDEDRRREIVAAFRKFQEVLE